MDHFDIVVAGGGPAGLSFASALAGSNLRVAVVERQPESALADPAFDGREIALTHRSVALLQGLGAWSHIPEADISVMREAHVLNGPSTYRMTFDPGPRRAGEPLGHLVANHLIRRAVHRTATACPDVTLIAGATVAGVSTSAAGAEVRLADGRTLAARLVVAADTRFSELRRRQGIRVRMQDFGRVMMVCRVAHDEQDHDHVATEWFDYGQTIAMLPVNGRASSFVLTLPAAEMEAVMAMDEESFSADATRRYQGRLGPMRLVSTRHAYPLVATYAERFASTRFALMGDAAVGMHPVTAHGFNFGLRGADSLATRIRRALARGQDIGADSVLRSYERDHRLATWPTYAATNLTARLYAEESPPARLVRDGVLRLGNALPAVRRVISARLMESGRPSFLPG